MENRLDTEFGNLAISEGFATLEQVYICQCIADTFEDENSRESLDIIMKDRGYITLEQEAYLFQKLGITLVLCPHCNKRSKEANTDLQHMIHCKYCGERFEYRDPCQLDTQQTTLMSDKTLAAFQQSSCDLYIGKLLGKKYQILEKVAVGGWSTIYKAKRMLLDIDDIVAVKILHINLRDNLQDLKRFYNEAATIRELRHPNAIHLYDFDRDANGTIYMAMEFIHGKNLKETIKNTGHFDIARMLNIIFQVCDVISVAHKHPKKIIHRDITPQNVMLSKVGDADDFVKVLDFGIAKLRIHDNVSLTGSIVGTPLYMAPEQWRGECDERTDIYSLGIIMYEMLTGEPPFTGDQITLMNKHLHEKPQPFRKLHKNYNIPKYIENIIFYCLEKNKDKRPQSVDELKSLLRREKCRTRIHVKNYSTKNVFVVTLIILPILCVLYLSFFPKAHKKPTQVSKNIYVSDAYNETGGLQKNDDTMLQGNSLQTFPNEKTNSDDGLLENTNGKMPALQLHYINDLDSNTTVDEKTPDNNKHVDKVVDNIRKYAINKDTKEVVPKPDTKEIVKREIQNWLQEYKKAWEKGDIETLKELGHISSEKEENKLRNHYVYVHDVRVSIHNETIEVSVDNTQATVSFDRTDEWTDERGNQHKEVLPRITKTLRKEDKTWKITKKTHDSMKQPSIYKNVFDTVTTTYSGLRKQLDTYLKK